MANTSDLLNRLACTAGDVIGTGTAHCQFDFTNMSGGGVGLLTKGTPIPATITQSALIDLQQQGRLIVLKGIFSVEDQGSDDQVETSSAGIEVLGTKGLMKFNVMFTNGIMYNRALSSLESNGRYETIMWDNAGNVLCRTDVNGAARGYTTGQILKGRPVLAEGATAAKQSLSFQWTRISEFNDNVSYLNANDLAAEDISFLDLDGVNQMQISLNAVSSGATSVTGKLVSAFDSNLTDITLVADDFRVNGVAPSAITINADGTFDLTVTAVSTDDELLVSLNGIVKNQADVLYKSNTAKVVVTA